MKARPDSSRRLRLEPLETRTLLAADLADPFGLTSDLNLALAALSGSGDYQAAFDTHFGNHRLVISGTAASALSIDLNQLPSFVTNIEISSVGSVVFSGADHVENLVLNGVGSVTAPGLTVNAQVLAKDVGSLSLAEVDGHATLYGSEMKFSIHSFGGVEGLPGDILSAVKTLTLTTDAPHADIYFVGNHAEQTIVVTDTVTAQALRLHGDDGTAIRIVLPPIDGGNTDPNTPSNGGDSGTGNGDPSPTGGDTKPDPFIIVTLPLDESMRVFLAQLRQLLGSSQPGMEDKVLSFLGHGTLTLDDSSPAANLIAQKPTFVAPPLNTSIVVADMPGLNVDPLMEASKFAPRAFEPVALQSADPLLAHSGDSAPAYLSDGLMPHLVQVDVSWPIALSPNDPRSSAGAARSENGDKADPSVTDGVKALGTYIVDRIVAEFSPGQQSLVLLVDPQPTRPVESRKAAAERAAVPSLAPALAADPIVI